MYDNVGCAAGWSGGVVEDERERGRSRARRKDRLVQARVPRDLESTLKREARRRRLTVSHLIRNVLEDTFQLVDDVVANVDDIVNESVEIARRVGRDARRVADAVRDAVVEDAWDTEDEGPRRTAAEGAASQSAPEPPSGTAASDAATETAASDPLAHVYAWNAVVANQPAHCARCGAAIARGAEAFVGLSDEPGRGRTWLCADCRAALQA
jgi:hypothetical protein